MKDVSTCLVDMKEKVATVESEKRLLANSNVEHSLLQHGKGLRVPKRETVILQLSLPCS